MAQIKIEAIIEIDENVFGLDDQEEREWFMDMMNDKKNTNLMLWSNDIGNEIGSTFQFKWELIDKTMAQQSAINWLRKKLEETYDKERKLPLAYTFSLLNKAEQMEKEQIVNAFDCDGSPQPGEKWISNGEQYYNETYSQ